MKNKETVFLTVGTEEQKRICEKTIAENKDFFTTAVKVVVDGDSDCRIGSGGAILNLISEYYEPGCKIAVINSGGKSKRSLNYAVKGKVFTNVEADGRTTTLFELLYDNALKLMTCFDSGLLVFCSDILFDVQNFSDTLSENTGFCVSSDLSTATRHGVMFCNTSGELAEFPHKSTAERLEQIRSRYNMQDFPIDTGTVFLKEALCLELKELSDNYSIVKKLIRNKSELNLYSDIIPLFAECCNKSDYLESGSVSSSLLEIKEILFEALSGYSLKVVNLENQPFRHFGSLKESLANILELAEKKDSYVSLNSHITDSCIGKNTLLDNVILKKGCRIGNNCILSDVSFDENTEIKDNTVVCGMKLKDESFVTIVCDIDEDPKKISGSKELWETNRFYKGDSFNDSFNKFLRSSSEPTYSIGYCIENADAGYLYTRSQYIKELTSFATNDKYLKIREKILNNYFKNKPPLSRVNFRHDKIVIKLPLRVNLSGTWTDAMPYCIDNGGQVINMAVTVNGERPITITLEKLPEKTIELCNDGVTTAFNFKSRGTVEADLSDFNLHQAVLKTIGITEDTALTDGFRLTTEVSDIDKGSGLGISSILLGGCLRAFIEMLGTEYDETEMLGMVFVAEQIMGTGGGWQDQVGGLLPSIKSGTTLPGIEQRLHIDYIALPDSFRGFFSERLVIIPTGQRHFGRFIVNDVADRYLSGNKDSIFGHKEIRLLNDKLTDSIRRESYADFCGCINRHFELLKYISPLVSNKRIDLLVNDCLEHIADAASVCGAGGGGYVFAVLKENITVKDAQSFIAQNYPYINSQVKQIQLLTEI